MPPCEPESRTRPRDPAAPGPAPVAIAFVLPARLAAPWAARSRVQQWLTAHGVEGDFADDLVYLVSEAVSNAAEHAYPPDTDGAVVEVQARLEPDGPARRVRVTVRDHGAWRPVDPDPGHRGHGLAAMAALAQELTVRRHPGGGTEVEVLSPPEPATAPAAPPR